MIYNLKNKNKIFCFSSLVILVATLVLSSVFLCMESGHSHEEQSAEHCPICVLIAVCKDNIKLIKHSKVSQFSLLFVFLLLISAFYIKKLYVKEQTLVSMKIRLND